MIIDYKCGRCKEDRCFDADIAGSHLVPCGNCGWLNNVIIGKLPECVGSTSSSEGERTGSTPVGSNLSDLDREFLEELNQMVQSSCKSGK